MTRTRKTKATANAAEAVQAPEPPDAYLKRHMEDMAILTFDTLQRAIAGGLGIQLSVHTVAVEVCTSGHVTHGQSDGSETVNALGFAAQAGLLMGAARALQAADDSACG